MHHKNKTTTENKKRLGWYFTIPTHYIIQDQQITEKVQHKDNPHSS
jgi:hypothetical protein